MILLMLVCHSRFLEMIPQILRPSFAEVDFPHPVVFLRSTSLALHAVRSQSISSDTGEDDEENQATSNAGGKVTNSETTTTPAPDTGVTEPERMDRYGKEEEEEQPDKLFIHLRDNMETIREFCKNLMQQIPTPDHCTIEGSSLMCVRACVCVWTEPLHYVYVSQTQLEGAWPDYHSPVL